MSQDLKTVREPARYLGKSFPGRGESRCRGKGLDMMKKLGTE